MQIITHCVSTKAIFVVMTAFSSVTTGCEESSSDDTDTGA